VILAMPETMDFIPQTRFEPQGSSGSFVKTTLLPGMLVLVIILAGTATGWFFSQGKTSIPVNGQIGEKLAVAPGGESGGREAGLDDVKTFRDRAEGTLKYGGIDSEGTHHLERPGGTSQSVYLTSSVVDLDQFVDKKVEVWGETIGAKKAGWLMDVGKIKILE